MTFSSLLFSALWKKQCPGPEESVLQFSLVSTDLQKRILQGFINKWKIKWTKKF